MDIAKILSTAMGFVGFIVLMILCGVTITECFRLTKRFLNRNKKACLWSRADDDTDLWETSCDQAFCLTNGTPKANDFKFCCYCGKEIIEDSDCVPAVDF